ncbi:phosphomannose isomerase type I-like protein [Coriobacteriaceae bacterium BV3Ac1]|nr:phosphomannose isomerase type I-like protein [Coriobacteriaceae bacterium BV3Ac1]
MQEMIRLKPALVSKIWGGTRLGSPAAGQDNYGEAWTLSARDDYPSIVDTGSDAGKTLVEYLVAHPSAAGSNAHVMEAFPTLIKFIDAASPLSVQVHPDDSYAHSHGMPYGKTEMWVIVDADPGSFLYLGLREDMTPNEFAAAIADNSIEEKLNQVPVKPGDVFFIRAGLLHAIGGGILLAEVQQNSDTTYRVYDFGRVDSHGKTRELHIEQAKEVALLEQPGYLGAPVHPSEVAGGTRQLLGQGTCFRTERWILNDTAELPITDKSYVALMMLNGNAQAKLGEQIEHIKTGETWFIPAGNATVHVTPTDGVCTLLYVCVPSQEA